MFRRAQSSRFWRSARSRVRRPPSPTRATRTTDPRSRARCPRVDARVVAFDDRLEIEVEPGHEATVLGYEDEPYVRVLEDGTVEVNRRSPTSYLNEDRFAEVEVPDAADADAAPEWEAVAAQGRYGWHDHRIHYMARDLPPQVTDESVETEVFDWAVPIAVDGDRGRIDRAR